MGTRACWTDLTSFLLLAFPFYASPNVFLLSLLDRPYRLVTIQSLIGSVITYIWPGTMHAWYFLHLICHYPLRAAKRELTRTALFESLFERSRERPLYVEYWTRKKFKKGVFSVILDSKHATFKSPYPPFPLTKYTHTTNNITTLSHLPCIFTNSLCAFPPSPPL